MAWWISLILGMAGIFHFNTVFGLTVGPSQASYPVEMQMPTICYWGFKFANSCCDIEQQKWLEIWGFIGVKIWLWSSGLWHHLALWVITNVLEERTVFIFTIEVTLDVLYSLGCRLFSYWRVALHFNECMKSGCSFYSISCARCRMKCLNVTVTSTVFLFIMFGHN